SRKEEAGRRRGTRWAGAISFPLSVFRFANAERSMNRRDFVSTLGAATVATLLPISAFAQKVGYARTLVLVELKGGNDGLNTVVPYPDGESSALRPTIGIARDRVLQLDERTGLHPALEPLLALWKERELAVVQGVGYPAANLSHFRSIEIWDTA